MSGALELVYAELPPSVNQIHEIKWFHVGKTRRSTIGYTKEAENWLQRFKDSVGRTHMREITMFVRDDRPTDLYEVVTLVTLTPEMFLNKSWLNSGKSKAKTPYKVVDVGNFSKLLDDAIVSVLGRIDDSRFTDNSIKKCVGPVPMIEVVIIRRDPRDFSVPIEYLGREDAS